MLNRRFQFLLTCLFIITFFFIIFTSHGPTQIPGTRISLPKYNGPAVHKPPPPEQPNSSSGEARWFSDWNWLNPFSSSITLDESRSVLPPSKARPPIYTFYDSTKKKDKDLSDAENELLLTWRRAWWAQGFKPMVLGWPEAMNNPLYEEVQRLELNGTTQEEMARWLAWDNMGGGILVNWLAVPMAKHEDHLLTFFRRGEYPDLTKYDTMGTGLFIGEKAAITPAIQAIIKNLRETRSLKSLLDAIPKESITTDDAPEGIALYDIDTIKKQYKIVSDRYATSEPAGLRSLSELINAHLHITWQNTYYSGIAVLKPQPEHTTALVEWAAEIARNLSTCPSTPMVSSCPPNRPKCEPCVSSRPMVITTPNVLRNDSTSVYQIGTVPHPYTLNSLVHQKATLDIPFVRRHTQRDQWVTQITKELLGTGVSAVARVIRLKDAVASEYGSSHTLWLTAERESHKDLDWIFGFRLPREEDDRGHSETPVPGPERRPPPPKIQPVPLSQEALQKERDLYEGAREVVKGGGLTRSAKMKQLAKVKDAIEAWNLVDSEAWRFVRAYSARRRLERKNWEEDEKAFAGAEERGSAWGRWFDFDSEDD